MGRAHGGAGKQPSDLARLPVFVWCEGAGGEPQLLSHIAVGETVQGVFPRQEHLKEHALVARQGIEGSGHLKTSEVGDVLEHAVRRIERHGTVAVDMDPLSLLCRLATSVPPPRFHTIH